MLPEDGLAVSYMIPFEQRIHGLWQPVISTMIYETLLDPWVNIIAHSPQYHGVKIKNRPKKEKRTYEKLIETVCENWDDVVAKCPQAKRFDEDVRDFLIKQKTANV